MSAAAPVSVMIFTLNEEIHLPSCLAALEWCADVIVIDSFSTDRTEAICRERGVRFFQHAFDGFGSQRNWALDHAEPRYPWVLMLDADERVPQELARELCDKAQNAPSAVGAFRVRRRFYMWGRWLRYSSLYPTWVVRFVHKDRVRYVDRGHAETQEVNGDILDLENDLIDENLKGIEEWFERQNRYSSKDAEYELAGADTAGGLGRRDVRRRAAQASEPETGGGAHAISNHALFSLQLCLSPRVPRWPGRAGVLPDESPVPAHGRSEEARSSTEQSLVTVPRAIRRAAARSHRRKAFGTCQFAWHALRGAVDGSGRVQRPARTPEAISRSHAESPLRRDRRDGHLSRRHHGIHGVGDSGLPVFSSESSARHFGYSQARFVLDRKVHVVHADSRAFLRAHFGSA